MIPVYDDLVPKEMLEPLRDCVKRLSFQYGWKSMVSTDFPGHSGWLNPAIQSFSLDSGKSLP